MDLLQFLVRYPDYKVSDRSRELEKFSHASSFRLGHSRHLQITIRKSADSHVAHTAAGHRESVQVLYGTDQRICSHTHLGVSLARRSDYES